MIKKAFKELQKLFVELFSVFGFSLSPVCPEFQFYLQPTITPTTPSIQNAILDKTNTLEAIKDNIGLSSAASVFCVLDCVIVVIITIINVIVT